MAKTTDLTPILDDFPELVGIPSGATIILSIDGQRDYEITLAQLQSLAGWNGTGTPGGGTGDVEYEVLASTDDNFGATLIGVPGSISAAAGGATTLSGVLAYLFGEDGALFRGDAGPLTESPSMPSSYAFTVYAPETGDFAYVTKDAVELGQGTSQGNAVVTSASAYTIGANDVRVTGDSASAQVFTLPDSTASRPLFLPLRVRRSGAGTVKVEAPVTVTINGALGGSVDLGARFSALDLDQIAPGRWECSAAAAETPNDIVAPTVVTFFPADGATNVPVNVIPYAEFSEPIVAGTGNIVIRDNDGGFADLYTYDAAADSGTTAGKFSISGNRLTIYPDAALANSIEHAIGIAGTAIDDLVGNSFLGIANDTTWSFTTVPASISNVTIVTSGSFVVAAGDPATSHVEPISGLLQNDVLYVAQACEEPIGSGAVAGFQEIATEADAWGSAPAWTVPTWIGRKVQTASPDTTITVPRAAARRKAVVWWVVRGANANIDGGAALAGSGTNTVADGPAYTQTNPNMMPFTVVAIERASITFVAPSGWTLLQGRQDGSPVGSERSAIAVAYKAVSASAGTVHDPGAWSGTGFSGWRAATFGQH